MKPVYVLCNQAKMRNSPSRLGFRVAGIDLLKAGLIKASRLALEYGVAIQPVLADLTKAVFGPASLGLIVRINFLERPLLMVLMEVLKPKGGVFQELDKELTEAKSGIIVEKHL